MKMNPLAEKSALDLKAEIKNVNLAKLNDFLKAYGGFDVNKGNFGLYTEFAAQREVYVMYLFPKIQKLRKNLPILNRRSTRKEKHFTELHISMKIVFTEKKK